MIGDSTDAVWGVMDVYPQTNFPDIRKKVIVRTKAGSLLIIPREGGSLVRFYIELADGTVAKEVTLEVLQSTARRIFQPYQMDFADTIWWSAYSIGQRHADIFSQDNRVFLAGDACHTHSPKAGQGMNTSLQDGYNIGWKLALVLKRQASPKLLQTYILERQKVAIDLIEFDRKFAAAFSSKSKEDFSDYFIKAGRYTAGLTKRYDQSEITNINGSDTSLAHGLDVGMRFPSTQVVRFCDAKPLQLVKALPADGRWRIVIFAGNAQDPEAILRLNEVCRPFTNEFKFTNGFIARRFSKFREQSHKDIYCS
jgi:phenol 2-monooxygenase